VAYDGERVVGNEKRTKKENKKKGKRKGGKRKEGRPWGKFVTPTLTRARVGSPF
jgi:hypothetical protein